MSKNDKHTYRRSDSRKKKILIRRWILVILVMAILIGATAFAANMIMSNDDAKPPEPTQTPASTVGAGSSAPSSPTVIHDKASPNPSPSSSPQMSPGMSPETSASPADTSNPENPQESSAAVTASAEVVSANLMDAIKKPDGIKTAYLTFDDGPTKSVTPKILDTLRRYNIKATFFEIGIGIESNPDMARRVYEEGHLIANHSYGHDYHDLYVTSESFWNEVTKTEELIRNVTGQDEIFKLFRFPGGSFKSTKDSWSSKKQEYKELLQENGYLYCDWNSLNGDAEGQPQPKTKEQLVEFFKNSTGSNEDIVVLMHDAAAKKSTAEALPEICEYLIEQGYEFRRLDEFNK